MSSNSLISYLLSFVLSLVKNCLDKSYHHSETRIVVLRKLGQALVHSEQWERSEAVWMRIESEALAIDDDQKELTVLFELCEELIHLQLWDKARSQLDKVIAIVVTLDENWTKAEMLRELSFIQLQMSQWDKADATWAKAETLTFLLKEDLEKHTWASGELERVLEEMQREKIQQWEQIELVRAEKAFFASTIKKNWEQRTRAIHKYCKFLIQAHQWKRAEALLQEFEENEEKVDLLCELGQILTQAQLWNYAEEVWGWAEATVKAFESSKEKAGAFIKLAHSLIQAKQWRQVKAVIDTIEGFQEQVEILGKLGLAWIRAEQRLEAEIVWNQAETIVFSINNASVKFLALRELIKTLLEAHQWNKVKELINTIDISVEVQEGEKEDGLIDADHEEIDILLKARARLLDTQQTEFTERTSTNVEIVEHSLESSDIQEDDQVSLLTRHRRLRPQQIRREQIDKLTDTFEKERVKVSLLRELGNSLAQAQQ